VNKANLVVSLAPMGGCSFAATAKVKGKCAHVRKHYTMKTYGEWWYSSTHF
jgi:hypothetical protein